MYVAQASVYSLIAVLHIHHFHFSLLFSSQSYAYASSPSTTYSAVSTVHIRPRNSGGAAIGSIGAVVSVRHLVRHCKVRYIMCEVF